MKAQVQPLSWAHCTLTFIAINKSRSKAQLSSAHLQQNKEDRAQVTCPRQEWRPLAGLLGCWTEPHTWVSPDQDCIPHTHHPGGHKSGCMFVCISEVNLVWQQLNIQQRTIIQLMGRKCFLLSVYPCACKRSHSPTVPQTQRECLERGGLRARCRIRREPASAGRPSCRPACNVPTQRHTPTTTGSHPSRQAWSISDWCCGWKTWLCCCHLGSEISKLQ